MKIEESSRLSPEASNTEVSDRGGIAMAKWTEKKEDPENLGEKKCQNECCIDWTEGNDLRTMNNNLTNSNSYGISLKWFYIQFQHLLSMNLRAMTYLKLGSLL